MDLSNFATGNSTETTMVVKNPTNDQPFINATTGQPAMTITVISADSADYASAKHKAQNTQLKKLAPNRRLNVSAEELDNQALDLLVAATKDWSGIEWQNQPLACTADNVRMIYTKCPWLRDQVDQFINDRSNFLGN